jgi:hypothetical protein
VHLHYLAEAPVPPVGALGQLMLGDGGEEARGGQALAIGRFGEPGLGVQSRHLVDRVEDESIRL